MPDVCVDPEALDDLARSLRAAAEELDGRLTIVSAAFAAGGVASCVVPSLAGVAAEMRGAAADLARRADVARTPVLAEPGGASAWGHGLLDALGLVPALGEVADGLNALWYAAEGNTVDAALSAGAMVPFLGWGATAAKHGDEAYALVRRADVPGSVARSSAEGHRLTEDLRQTAVYGTSHVRTLPDDRIRYYGLPSPAHTPGAMAGRRFVREWDPATRLTREWHETVDGRGRVRQVRPVRDGPKVHYMFDEEGRYAGAWR